jgi:hypothetical protein
MVDAVSIVLGALCAVLVMAALRCIDPDPAVPSCPCECAESMRRP